MPRDSPDSYRPISLTPHACKWFERIINSRLEHYLTKHNILPNCQSGFRRYRSTTDNLVHLTEKFKHSLRRRNNVLYATFFDAHKAFDRLWHNKLLSKLANIGISGRMYKIIKDFLSKRKMRVQQGQTLSDFVELDMGCPQGAVLSPTLFFTDVVRYN